MTEKDKTGLKIRHTCERWTLCLGKVYPGRQTTKQNLVLSTENQRKGARLLSHDISTKFWKMENLPSTIIMLEKPRPIFRMRCPCL